jgi:hypothetical protein
MMVAYAWNLILRQKKTIWEGGLWTIFWVAIAYISLVPSSLQYLSAFTGIKKNENAATITAIGIVFFVLFYMIMRIEELQQRLNNIVREKALKDIGIIGTKENQESRIKTQE